ncbi:GIY-YIG nuclease family protein [Falsochrobactrum sp. TDYN1]|uniref:GIY-YIG nuclease family protein n=1 Tax=Falsochrobactrum tianjinense TaxID=2706015 RepID=A0A949PN09_9HYPH|nr:GIY-YIG nuclease family protein [Falsochrobactrum sp. TDYN1]MBV2143320.1 GIY-YIG nuclease family protein [Falsochrobactrum sp. TDYN1]
MRRHHLARTDLPLSNMLYSYPQHLQESAASAPNAPGIYIFRGKANDYPVYIGKSINLRARLLSHLRTKAEKRLLAQAGSIEIIRTAGEFSALLLEAQLIKRMQPMFNKMLRATSILHSIRVTDDTVEIEAISSPEFSESENLHGLFRSRRSAEELLRALADQHGLCLAVMGMESTIFSRGCFRHSLKRCHGACCGHENIKAHNDRLGEALAGYRIRTWPFAGFVGLKEKYEELTSIHLIKNWHYYGTVQSLDDLDINKVSPAPIFDADIYKILVAAMFNSKANLIEV